MFVSCERCQIKLFKKVKLQKKKKKEKNHSIATGLLYEEQDFIMGQEEKIMKGCMFYNFLLVKQNPPQSHMRSERKPQYMEEIYTRRENV